MSAQQHETFLRITDRDGVVHAVAGQEDGTAKTICRGTYRTGKGGSRVWHFRSYGAENYKNCPACFNGPNSPSSEND